MQLQLIARLTQAFALYERNWRYVDEVALLPMGAN
jgi:hypothetical protein